MAKIKLKNVSFGYNDGFSVINNVSISVLEGEFVSVIGPSGCGKSTILNLLAGLNFPTGGSILLDGRRIVGPGSERGVVFQHYSLFPWMTARQNIVFGLKQVNRAKTKKELEKAAAEYLELVGLREFADKYPAQLSGGMQQRVAIARAFAMDSDILLMDEPFSAVDAINRMALQELLLNLWDNGAKRKTIVFVTHDVDEAILLSDRVVLMSAGAGMIKDDMAIDFKRPRNRTALLKSAAFSELRNTMVDLLYDDLLEQNGVEAAL